ncbi:MAG: type IX secretion system sortase PorU, partial [Bacteroidales bacterium]|nr:type IX secretion system sortase PorU [Bacteroidales bacterium]
VRFYAPTVMFGLIFILMGKGVYAQSSVLSTGTWHRFTIQNNGIYKIRFEDLKSKGILANPVPASQIALYGGENGMLSEVNRSDERTDWQEMAIHVETGGSATFGNGSYILFYAQSPNRWIWDGQKYTHQTNVYTNTMVYCLTTDATGERKRIAEKPRLTSSPTVVITSFKDHYLYEREIVNPKKSSQEWYGETLSQTTSSLDINLDLQGLDISQKPDIKVRLVINESGRVVISCNNQSYPITGNKTNSNWLMELNHQFSWSFADAAPRLSFKYEPSKSSSEMYLDYIEVHYQRQLALRSSPVQFRFAKDTTAIGEFRIGSANANSRVWDISNPLEPLLVQTSLNNTTLSFSEQLAGRPEFIGFSDNAIQTIANFEAVPNQNLRGEDSVQYVIVVHPNFRKEADRLAEFHRNRGLTVLVTTPNDVFNEFSFGRQDPMAIRRLLRHYKKTNLNMPPEYLLLFGSPSYDYRNLSVDPDDNGLQNFVLNYQYPTGLIEGNSLSTDDVFGFLDDASDTMSIGIGRFPARTEEDAKTLVDKTIAYTQPHFGDWRTVVTNLADDGVTEPFPQTYEDTRNHGYFEPEYKTKFKDINVEKIYADAYPQAATPSGARYPELKTNLKQRIERGTLILNYEGHSGAEGFADEDLLNRSDIAGFENSDRLTVLFAASCSFVLYDNAVVSAGEAMVLSPEGGAVGVIATTRVAYTSPNDVFHGALNRFALTRTNGKPHTLGEIIRMAKNQTGNAFALKPFVLLGDPALPLALPKYQVATSYIKDTIKALDTVTISGYISDFENRPVSDFNGEVMITVYDKPTKTKTLGNKNSTAAGNNPVLEYEIQKNVLFKGKASVINGVFETQFTTPKDINYSFGLGKISYYAFSDSVDASGYFDRVTIGGFGENFDIVADAPNIRLFINDTNFKAGNITTPNPVLYVQINDQYGINYSGTGIGHNISLILDDDARNQIYLNDYFEYLSGSNTAGELYYPMFDLPVGKHNLKVKVWNIFNISTVDTIEFEVIEKTEPYIAKAYNYPNPVRDFTKFYFTHNAPKKIKRVEIDIFDVSGRWMTRLSKSMYTEGFAIEPIEWNTTNSQGYRLRQG